MSKVINTPRLINETLYFKSITNGYYDYKMSSEEISKFNSTGEISTQLMDYLIYHIVSSQNLLNHNFTVVSEQFLLAPNKKTSFFNSTTLTKKYILVPLLDKTTNTWYLAIMENIYMKYTDKIFCKHVSEIIKDNNGNFCGIKVILSELINNKKEKINEVLSKFEDSLNKYLKTEPKDINSNEFSSSNVIIHTTYGNFERNANSGKCILQFIKEMIENKYGNEDYINKIFGDRDETIINQETFLPKEFDKKLTLDPSLYKKFKQKSEELNSLDDTPLKHNIFDDYYNSKSRRWYTTTKPRDDYSKNTNNEKYGTNTVGYKSLPKFNLNTHTIDKGDSVGISTSSDFKNMNTRTMKNAASADSIKSIPDMNGISAREFYKNNIKNNYEDDNLLISSCESFIPISQKDNTDSIIQVFYKRDADSSKSRGGHTETSIDGIKAVTMPNLSKMNLSDNQNDQIITKKEFPQINTDFSNIPVNDSNSSLQSQTKPIQCSPINMTIGDKINIIDEYKMSDNLENVEPRVSAENKNKEYNAFGQRSVEIPRTKNALQISTSNPNGMVYKRIQIPKGQVMSPSTSPSKLINPIYSTKNDYRTFNNNSETFKLRKNYLRTDPNESKELRESILEKSNYSNIDNNITNTEPSTSKKPLTYRDKENENPLKNKINISSSSPHTQRDFVIKMGERGCEEDKDYKETRTDEIYSMPINKLINISKNLQQLKNHNYRYSPKIARPNQYNNNNQGQNLSKQEDDNTNPQTDNILKQSGEISIPYKKSKTSSEKIMNMKKNSTQPQNEIIEENLSNTDHNSTPHKYHKDFQYNKTIPTKFRNKEEDESDKEKEVNDESPKDKNLKQLKNSKTVIPKNNFIENKGKNNSYVTYSNKEEKLLKPKYDGEDEEEIVNQGEEELILPKELKNPKITLQNENEKEFKNENEPKSENKEYPQNKLYSKAKVQIPKEKEDNTKKSIWSDKRLYEPRERMKVLNTFFSRGKESISRDNEKKQEEQQDEDDNTKKIEDNYNIYVSQTINPEYIRKSENKNILKDKENTLEKKIKEVQIEEPKTKKEGQEELPKNKYSKSKTVQFSHETEKNEKNSKDDNEVYSEEPQMTDIDKNKNIDFNEEIKPYSNIKDVNEIQKSNDTDPENNTFINKKKDREQELEQVTQKQTKKTKVVYPQNIGLDEDKEEELIDKEDIESIPLLNNKEGKNKVKNSIAFTDKNKEDKDNEKEKDNDIPQKSLSSRILADLQPKKYNYTIEIPRKGKGTYMNESNEKELPPKENEELINDNDIINQEKEDDDKEQIGKAKSKKPKKIKENEQKDINNENSNENKKQNLETNELLQKTKGSLKKASFREAVAEMLKQKREQDKKYIPLTIRASAVSNNQVPEKEKAKEDLINNNSSISNINNNEEEEKDNLIPQIQVVLKPPIKLEIKRPKIKGGILKNQIRLGKGIELDDTDKEQKAFEPAPTRNETENYIARRTNFKSNKKVNFDKQYEKTTDDQLINGNDMLEEFLPRNTSAAVMNIPKKNLDEIANQNEYEDDFIDVRRPNRVKSKKKTHNNPTIINKTPNIETVKKEEKTEEDCCTGMGDCMIM